MAQLDAKQFKDATITQSKMANNSVGSAQIIASNILDTHLAASAKSSVLDSKRFSFAKRFTGFTSTAASSDNITDKAVTASTSKKTNGSSTDDGIVTNASFNYTQIRDAVSNDPVKDSSNRQVFGRTTRTLTTLTGSLTFTNGSTAVTGSGTAFTTELAVGDYIQLNADGVASKVASITNDTALVLAATYAGAGGTGASSEVNLNLSYLVDIAGTETAHTMPVQALEVQFPESFTIDDSPFDGLLAPHGFIDVAFSSASGSEVVQQFTAEAVTAGNSFSTNTLSSTPGDATKVKLFVNGSLQKYGSGEDYTVSGTTVNWLATANFNIATTDEVIAVYFI